MGYPNPFSREGRTCWDKEPHPQPLPRREGSACRNKAN